jgi:hypothetical protein
VGCATLWKPEKPTPVALNPGDTPTRGETRVSNSGWKPRAEPEERIVRRGSQAGAMSTATFMVEFLASVKITPLTGGTSP